MAVSFGDIFMATIETTLIQQSETKSEEWNDTFTTSSPSGTVIKKTWINLLNKLANSTLATIKFTAKISENEITFLDTVVFKGERLKKESILDVKTHYKPTETFQYIYRAVARAIAILIWRWARTARLVISDLLIALSHSRRLNCEGRSSTRSDRLKLNLHTTFVFIIPSIFCSRNPFPTRDFVQDWTSETFRFFLNQLNDLRDPIRRSEALLFICLIVFSW